MFEGIFQPIHLLVIVIVILIFFGPGKLPEIGSSLGKAIRDFKKAMSEPEKDPDEKVERVEDKKDNPR